MTYRIEFSQTVLGTNPLSINVLGTIPFPWPAWIRKVSCYLYVSGATGYFQPQVYEFRLNSSNQQPMNRALLNNVSLNVGSTDQALSLITGGSAFGQTVAEYQKGEIQVYDNGIGYVLNSYAYNSGNFALTDVVKGVYELTFERK